MHENLLLSEESRICNVTFIILSGWLSVGVCISPCTAKARLARGQVARSGLLHVLTRFRGNGSQSRWRDANTSRGLIERGANPTGALSCRLHGVNLHRTFTM
jgi:hypothetical protein